MPLRAPPGRAAPGSLGWGPGVDGYQVSWSRRPRCLCMCIVNCVWRCGFNRPASSDRTRLPTSGADNRLTTQRECHCHIGRSLGVSHGRALAWAEEATTSRQIPASRPAPTSWPIPTSIGGPRRDAVPVRYTVRTGRHGIRSQVTTVNPTAA